MIITNNSNFRCARTSQFFSHEHGDMHMSAFRSCNMPNMTDSDRNWMRGTLASACKLDMSHKV
jgi:hypothetical protein